MPFVPHEPAASLPARTGSADLVSAILTPMSGSVKELFEFCVHQPWWSLVEPLFSQDVIIDIHVSHIPEAAMRPDWPVRGEFGILVSKSGPGVVIVRVCADCKQGEPWHVRLGPREGALLEQIVQRVILQQQQVSSSTIPSAPADKLQDQKDWN